MIAFYRPPTVRVFPVDMPFLLLEVDFVDDELISAVEDVTSHVISKC